MDCDTYNFNLSAEALHWIIQRHIPVLLKHYLNDFLPIFMLLIPLSLVNKAIDWIQCLSSALSLSLQHEKTLLPSTPAECLGLELDTIYIKIIAELKTCCLCEKRVDYTSNLVSSHHLLQFMSFLL